MLFRSLEKFRVILSHKMKYPGYFKKGVYNVETRKLLTKSPASHSKRKASKKA
mgnify:FL=1